MAADRTSGIATALWVPAATSARFTAGNSQVEDVSAFRAGADGTATAAVSGVAGTSMVDGDVSGKLVVTAVVDWTGDVAPVV